MKFFNKFYIIAWVIVLVLITVLFTGTVCLDSVGLKGLCETRLDIGLFNLAVASVIYNVFYFAVFRIRKLKEKRPTFFDKD
ncbi:MAG: hypothetical protein NT120_05355 [Candidatus Aenigmarchaeota archaeon]|nr:hypothetical protein [Candidatus Aenigmarchaeota archaeon]